MKAIPFARATILKVFSLMIIIFFFSACGKKERRKETAITMESFTKNKQQNNNDQTEASFFIETANVSNSLISKSKIAQKSSESSIQEISKKIEDHQNRLLQQVSEIANKKLIIITDITIIHKRDIYELIDTNENTFKETYLNSITESLEEQIKLFEKIATESNDKTILKLVLQFLPEQYELLRETQRIKNTI